MHKRRLLITTLIFLQLLAGCSNVDEIISYAESKIPAGFLETNSSFAIINVNSYIEKIEVEDIELRKIAASITKGCSSGDKECQLNRIYRYVSDNLTYYSDPRSNEFIQSPKDTLEVRGGDCEDLTILVISLLENLGFKTYIILSANHAYALACDINVNDLSKYIEQDIIKATSIELGRDGRYEVEIRSGRIFLVKKTDEVISLSSLQSYYIGGNGKDLTDPIRSLSVDYSIKSSRPANLYFVPSISEQTKLSNNLKFSHFHSCYKPGTYFIEGSCNGMRQNGGIVIQNTDSKISSAVEIHLNFSYEYSDQNLYSYAENISYYNISGDKCIVLDTTAGKYGYPGYGSAQGEKIAIDPVTKDEYRLN